MSRKLSRKVIIALAAAAALAAPLLGSSASYARGFGGGMHFGGGGSHFAARSSFVGHRTVGISRVGRVGRIGRINVPRHPFHPIWIGHLHHPHMHWIMRAGRWVEVDDVAAVDVTPVTPAVAPGPCTCLTKTYTPTGLVVFADICTKESASAPVDSTADATQAPTTPPPPNFAGRTYQDYLAANPQAAAQAPAKN